MTKAPRGWHSRGYLPHCDGGDIPQTINIHLLDSLPRKVIDRWQEELSHHFFERAKWPDDYLANARQGRLFYGVFAATPQI